MGEHLRAAGHGAAAIALLAAAWLAGCAAPPNPVAREGAGAGELAAPNGVEPVAATPRAVAPAPGMHPAVVAPRFAAPAPTPAAPTPAAAADAEGWNAAQIAWRSFDEGRAEAARTHKPMMLVLYTSWCPHCRNFAHVFDDPTVTAAARDFVMVRANADAERELSQRFAPDGAYIPRTFFLSPAGELAPEVKAHEGRYQYFYDERDPSALVAGMHRARAVL